MKWITEELEDWNEEDSKAREEFLVLQTAKMISEADDETKKQIIREMLKAVELMMNAVEIQNQNIVIFA